MANEKLTAEEIERNAEQARQDNRDAVEGVEDQHSDSPADRQAPADDEPPAGDDAAERKVIHSSPQDEKRARISAAAAKMRGEPTPFDGDMTRDENLYGDVAAENLQPDPDAGEPGVPADAPAVEAQNDEFMSRKVTYKIRGEDVTKTVAEWMESGQIGEGTKSYLNEARDLVKELRTERAGKQPQRPEDADSTQDEELDSESSAARRPEQSLEDLVDKIQFGDRDEAATALGEYVSRTAEQQHLQRLYSNDLARSQQVMKEFSAANPQIADNKDAARLMEMHIYDVYRDDLEKVGLNPDEIPKDPRQLAHWHRHYRTHGHDVSSMKEVFEKAKSTVTKAMNLTPQTTQPATRPKDANGVRVSVDRTQRREAIPTQPSRAAAPQRTPQPQRSQESSRSAAVQNMRRARGQPTTGG